MPNNVPPPHEPPVWYDHILSHPELGVSAGAIVAGAGIAIDGLTGNTVLVRIPFLLAPPIGIVLMIAGTLAVLGVMVPKWADVEQHGWHILASTSVLLTVVLTYSHQFRLVLVFCMCWTAVGAIRAIGLWRIRSAGRRIDLIVGESEDIA